MRHASINTRLAISATLSILIGVAALVAYVSTSSYRMVAAIQENSLNQTARLIAQSAQNSIRDSVEVANSLASQDAILEAFTGSPARAQERLRSFVAGFPTYWSFFIFDTKGKILAGSNTEGTDLTGGERASRDYVQGILSGKDEIGRAHV